jgi:hypothetical protein
MRQKGLDECPPLYLLAKLRRCWEQHLMHYEKNFNVAESLGKKDNSGKWLVDVGQGETQSVHLSYNF